MKRLIMLTLLAATLSAVAQTYTRDGAVGQKLAYLYYQRFGVQAPPAPDAPFGVGLQRDGQYKIDYLNWPAPTPTSNDVAAVTGTALATWQASLPDALKAAAQAAALAKADAEERSAAYTNLFGRLAQVRAGLTNSTVAVSRKALTDLLDGIGAQERARLAREDARK